MAARPVFILTLRDRARRQRHSGPALVYEIRAQGLRPEMHENQPRKEGTMTAIEWTNVTWNPFAGCSVVSPGCTNCYAMRQAWRLAHNPVTPQYR